LGARGVTVTVTVTVKVCIVAGARFCRRQRKNLRGLSHDLGVVVKDPELRVVAWQGCDLNLPVVIFGRALFVRVR